ncbi:glycoside hydrolase family 65 protein [Dactylosporangium sp. CS-047395]|uniref:glycoside hydrolase family 65 protein n=1 Tax=Dactylosporangium sp. CS-047395 TaxID=3239936 RepID=UPI003D8AD3CF
MSFPVEPWSVTELVFDPSALDERESVFALGNGRIGVRGSVDEGDPCGLPATYLAGLFEERDLHYPEGAYGQPATSQTVVSAPDPTPVRLFADGQPLTARDGRLRHHRRRLDLRAGTLHRVAEWALPRATLRLESTRLVSFAQPDVVATRHVLTATGGDVRVHVHAETCANHERPADPGDPRAATVLPRPLRGELHEAGDGIGVLVHRTHRSLRRVGVAVAFDTGVAWETAPDLLRASITAVVRPGKPLAFTRFAALTCASEQPVPHVRAHVRAAAATARSTGWDSLAEAQRAYLDAYWRDADVEVGGDPALQQSVRFGLFHVLQAAAHTGVGPIPAKGLTGNGYDGHIMWDTESYVLPVLTYLRPDAARDALLWRHRTLPAAVDRARQLHFDGAAFPWRTIDGRECSGYFPAGAAALHVNADIADAVRRYRQATGDEAFMRAAGAELLTETARLWLSAGHFDDRGAFHIDGVTGPDEYSALGNDNVYTNLMAARNLRAAAEHATGDEAQRWLDAAASVHLPFDAKRGVHQQHAGFTKLAEWDFAGTARDRYPLLLHHPYLQLYRKQVVKQADLVLAMQRDPDAFTGEQKARNFAYYERRTVRDSSLSAAPQAVIAAEVGHLERAYAYLMESARQDLHNVDDKSRNGLHMASLAGVWTVLVAGFGGFRDGRGRLDFAPRLPRQIPHLAFTLIVRGIRLRVRVTHVDATYSVDRQALDVHHHGAATTVAAGRPQKLPIPPPPPVEALPEPPKPIARGAGPS